LQDTFLFKGTVRENIRYGRLDASNEDIMNAAKRSNAHGFIKRLPNGYDTMLDQDGSSISQGQKQLLTIARALIAEPSILILDEANSNIAIIKEVNMQDGLQRRMQGRISFLIGHRLSTIQKADNILMLEDGRILEQGSHSDLMKKQGAFYQLYSGKQEELNKGVCFMARLGKMLKKHIKSEFLQEEKQVKIYLPETFNNL